MLLVLSTPFCISAQQIQTDRPNETESPSAIRSHHLQIESGLSYEKEDGEKTFEVPELILRYGLIKNLEARIESAYSITHLDEETQNGIEPVVVGLKYHILDHKGTIIPDLAILSRVSIKWMADNAYQEEKYSPEVRLLAQHELSSKAHLGYNAGIHWLSDTANPEYIYTISADHSLTKKIKLVVETYGFSVPHHHSKTSADAALLFVLSKNMQLDLTAGTGIMHSNSEKFAAAGFSIRI